MENQTHVEVPRLSVRALLALVLSVVSLALVVRWTYGLLPTNLLSHLSIDGQAQFYQRTTFATDLWSAFLEALRPHLGWPYATLGVHRLLASVAVGFYVLGGWVAQRRGLNLDNRTLVAWGLLLALECRFVSIGAGDSFAAPVLFLSALSWWLTWLLVDETRLPGWARALLVGVPVFMVALLRTEAGPHQALALAYFFPREGRWKEDTRNPVLLSVFAASAAGVLVWLTRDYGVDSGLPSPLDVLIWFVAKSPFIAGAFASWVVGLEFLLGYIAYSATAPRDEHRRFWIAFYITMLPSLMVSFLNDQLLTIDCARYYISLLPFVMLPIARGAVRVVGDWSDQTPRRWAGRAVVATMTGLVLAQDLAPFKTFDKIETWQADFDFIRETQEQLPQGAHVAVLSALRFHDWIDFDTGLLVPHVLLDEMRPDLHWTMASPLESTWNDEVEYVYLATTCGLSTDLDHAIVPWFFFGQEFKDHAAAEEDKVLGACTCVRSVALKTMDTQSYWVRTRLPVAKQPMDLELVQIPKGRPACLGDDVFHHTFSFIHQ